MGREKIKKSEAEGVIKYRLDYTEKNFISKNLHELNTWRSILFELGLIGQDKERYQGCGYGNISCVMEDDVPGFVISGSQTGHLHSLGGEHYSHVTSCDINTNTVIARGLSKPSSESLTHAMIYSLDDRIECVIHVHSQGLWRFGLQNGYLKTDERISYGTVEIAQAVKQLYQSTDLIKQKILVMEGHEDGIICFGNSIEDAGFRLISMWVDAHI